MAHGKTEIVKEVSNETGLTKADAKAAVDAVFESIATSLEHGDGVTIFGFVNWSVKDRDARQGRNPATGEPMQIGAHKVIGFKSSKTLKNRVND